ncbi:MAG: RagB/SusD family nutrient uptake outer membrane protein, partial [Pedobacter sp.]
TISGCEKFLDEKPDKKLIVPETMRELQQLLDGYRSMNESDAASGEISAGDNVLPDADWAASTEFYRKMYIWDSHYSTTLANDWYLPYRRVYQSNVVLEEAEKIGNTDPAYNSVVGQALFFRSISFFTLATHFSLQYDPVNASKDMGIPLRLHTDFNEASKRSTNKETYDQVISDAKRAIRLLPVRQVIALRPSKIAAYGLLSRVYLAMNNFPLAKLYADSCLQYNPPLLNYNTHSTTAAYPFLRLNEEVIFESSMTSVSPIGLNAEVAPELYAMYEPNDLRKVLFFKFRAANRYNLKGSYENNIGQFNGIATDEIYLIRAECLVRAGNVAAGMDDLNTLLVKRYKTGTFIPLAVHADALKTVLKERRKELLMRGVRWSDLKRLNLLGENITLTRIVNGVTYTLEPNSLKYALPIPDEIVARGVTQNLR